MVIRFALAVWFGLAAQTAWGWEEPARGTELRSDLLNTVRVVAALKLNAPIEFVVHELRHENGLAFAALEPQRPGGAPIEWASTRLAASGESDAFYDSLTMHVFLLQKGRHWYVQDYSIGATDVWWHGTSLCDTYIAVIPEYCQ